MKGLRIEVRSVQPEPEAAAFVFRLQVELTGADEPVESLRLRAQVQIQPARRRYAGAEQAALEDLFGTPERWGTTLRPLYWTTVRMQLPALPSGLGAAELRVPWPDDVNAAATRYFYALQEGEIPVELLFSGTIFYRSGGHESADGIQVAFVPWSLEAACRIPVEVWREVRRRVQRQRGGRPLPVRAGLSWNQLLDDVLAAGKEQES